ncbi:MAG: hypothetical protein K8R44_04515 [Sulfurimonas sp.]|nr:hypothetical protein [Sulfurimonas sp.]
MKSPNGFGKKYFTFSSMLAHSVSVTLQSRENSAESYLNNKISSEKDELDESPPDEILELICEFNSKPCQCNCYYKLKTKIALLLNHFIPRCPFYTVCFAFRRTGVHPPLFIS